MVTSATLDYSRRFEAQFDDPAARLRQSNGIAIGVHDLRKSFGAVDVLKGIDLTIAPASSWPSSAAAAAARARCCGCSPVSTRRRRGDPLRRRGDRPGRHRAADVPGAAPAALADGPGQCRGGPRRRPRLARCGSAGARHAGPRRPRRPRGRVAIRAVRRPEAARRARPGAGQPAALPRPRRAARRARCADPHRDAGADRAVLAASRASRRCSSPTTSPRR